MGQFSLPNHRDEEGGKILPGEDHLDWASPQNPLPSWSPVCWQLRTPLSCAAALWPVTQRAGTVSWTCKCWATPQLHQRGQRKGVHFYLARLSGIKTQEISKPPQIPSLPLLISITAAATSGFQTIGDIMKSWGNGRKEQEEIFFPFPIFPFFFLYGRLHIS